MQETQTQVGTKIQIKHRYTGAVLFECDIPSEVTSGMAMRHAVERAVESDVNLSGANLIGSNLSRSNLSGAKLSGSNLSRSNLSGAKLSGSNLSGANLIGANLIGSNLSRSNLSGANLIGANLIGSNLSGSNLSGAKLSEANLIAFRDDVWAVLSSAPLEAQSVLDALRTGRVNGSTYNGECACLVGTIANQRGCDVESLGTLKPDSRRLAEVWFMHIIPGDTPDKHEPTRLAAEWVEQWIANMRLAFGQKEAA